MSEKLQCQNCGRAECGEDLYNYDGEILCRYCIVARVYEGSIPCEYAGTCNDKTYPNKTEQIDQLKQQLAEKEKENEELKLKLDIRAMNLQNINTERMEAVRNQTQLAIQELEKVKNYCDKQFNLWENNNFNETYDNTDVSHAYFEIAFVIKEKIKELKGE